MNKLKIKYFDKEIKKIMRPRVGDVGFDLFAAESKTLQSGEYNLIDTGIAMEIPAGFFGKIEDRSSVSKHCHVMAGVLDSSYRGPVKIAVFVHHGKDGSSFQINKGDKLAQVIFHRDFSQDFEIEEVDELTDTIRGSGGFGSTGV